MDTSTATPSRAQGLTQLSRVSRVLVCGAALGVLAWLFGDFLVVKPNRLLLGTGMTVIRSVPAWAAWTTGLAWLALTLSAWRPWTWLTEPRLATQNPRAPVIVTLYIALALILGCGLAWLAGRYAPELLPSNSPFARVSLGGGFWAMQFALFVVLGELWRTAATPANRRVRLVLALLAVAVLAGLLTGGELDQLSLMREFAARRERFLGEVARHMAITAGSVGGAVLLGVPLGILLRVRPALERSTFLVLNMVQTIPSLALFGLLIAPLSLLAARLPALKEVGVEGIGWTPAVIALGLYALLPVVRNTFAGLASVDPATREAGRGMGMTRGQILARVELPIAAPVLLNGVRIALVQTIGNTAVAALIGAGGLGVFIFQGLGQAALDLILLGTVPTVGLALGADVLMQAITLRLTPRGLRVAEATQAETATQGTPA